ncbi:MAG: hypothetical protein HUJ96_05910 [Marinilabiliaceae bacterium]|nr:hypothetical protein [Marinilabiliaceae bacterium]
MIVNMFKYSFVIFHADYERFLSDIQNLGVLHVLAREGDSSDETLQLLRKSQDVRKTIQQLSSLSNEKSSSDVIIPDNGEELIQQITEDTSRLKGLKAKLQAAERDLLRYEPWGGSGFDPDCIAALQKAGITVTLLQCPERSFNEQWTKEGAVEIISRQNGVVYFITLSTHYFPAPDIEAESVELPLKTPSELNGDIALSQGEIFDINQRLATYAEQAKPILEKYADELDGHVQLLIARQSTSSVSADTLRVIEGFVPSDNIEAIDRYISDNNIVCIKRETNSDDKPPVKLCNNKFAQLFEPITEMFSLPNYSEIDPTPLFAPFFMLFFGLCLGDAGYGILVLIVSILARRKVGKGMKLYCDLGIVLGIATIVISTITGMLFGIDLSKASWIPSSLRSLFITDSNLQIAGYSPMMVVAILLGLIQILFGMCVNAAKISKQHGKRYAISTISWVVILPVLAITFGLPAMGVALPTWITYTLYGVIGFAVIGIFFFNTPNSGILTNIGSGVWNTYNMATGLLGDTLSYIRLFALGLTGGILGSVFNTMAFQAGEGLPIVAKILVISLILIIGHSINIGLCLIGAFVHPMRLTFVEFYKNSGFEGGGIKYNPLKK